MIKKQTNPGGKGKLTLRKTIISAPAGVAQWIQHWLLYQNATVQFPVRTHAWVVGQVPSWGAGEATS